MTPEIAEIINATRTILGVFVLGIFVRYIIFEFKSDGAHTPRIRAAFAVIVYVLGETVMASWFWLWRYLQDTSQSVRWMETSPISLIAIIVIVAGQLLLLRIFAPRGCGNRTWIVGLLVALTVSASMVVMRIP